MLLQNKKKSTSKKQQQTLRKSSIYPILFFVFICNLLIKDAKAESLQKICGRKLTRLIEDTYQKITPNDCKLMNLNLDAFKSMFM